MRDILVTSSVLILALLVLRQVFRKTISRRVQYALWGLVLLRLLVPVSLPAVEHNVLTTAEPIGTTVSQQMEHVSVYFNPVAQAEIAQSALVSPDISTPAVVVRDSRSETVSESRSSYPVCGHSADAVITSEDGTHRTWYAKALTLTEALTYIWYAGVAVMACWLVISNLRFWRKLRKARIPYSIENCRYRVYLVESGLPSPCLFGLFRPAIYLTPAAAATPESLRHVLAHETTHARHLDPLWSLLRGVCLAVYWFDPLVWAAAVVSRTDCELACDEGALKRLGLDERVAYGRTLLSLIPVVKRPANPVLTATTMTSDKRQLKDRITRIAENRQTVAAALFAVVAVAVLLCAVTFTGAKTPAESQFLSAEELAQFNADFFGEREDAPFRRQFLTSLYEQPEDIDMFQLFYNGTGQPSVIESDERKLLVDTYYDGTDPEVDLTKLPAREIDQVLERYTGLTLAETQALGMGGFRYLADYDAYYHFHGDTNAFFHFSFAAGEREGNLVRLYYRADGLYAGGDFGQYGDGWCCLTLEEIPAGAVDGFPYHFVSNQLCERPDHLLSDITALTGTELAYFNETFFNNDTVDNVVGLNIHNQFLTSLYARPDDIDLYELFYCGTGLRETMSDTERQLVCAFDADCPTDKLSVSAINSVLLENTGLTLDQTNRIGLEDFTYLEQYDAYYHTHGDTNYFHSVQITAGEREGSTIRLYYSDNGHYAEADWLCVTLEEQPDGSYWFVSNQLSEKPAIPTVLPEGDPVLTIPLTDLTPYEPETMPVERHMDDCADRDGGWVIDAENGEEVRISPYLSTDGTLYAAIKYESAAGSGQMLTWDVGCFFTFPENNSIADGESTVNTFFFSDLFGHNGWQVSYSGQLSEHHWTTFTDYYYFEDDQTPVLLAHTHGLNSQVIDLDGDGANELINEDNQLFFQRDGKLYEADITALLQAYWPEMTWWDYSILDANSRCLMVKGFVEMPAWGENGQADFIRYIYYDGENLLVYDDLEDTEGHAAISVLNSDIPEQVLADGKAQAQAAYEAKKSSEWDYDYDDWRVSYLSKAGTYTEFGELTIEVYSLGYQFHTAEPTTVMLAGGMYLLEDGWVGGFSVENSPYLVYQRKEDGTRIQLESRIDGDCSINSPAYQAGLCWTLLVNGLLQPSDIPAKDLLVMFYMSPASFLNKMTDYPESEQTAVFSALASFRDGGGQEEQSYLREGLQTLEWTLRDLTEQGRTAYERLQAALSGTVATETALAQFTTNPAAFLQSAALLPEKTQREVCQALAYYYDRGSSAQQARFRDAMHAVTQEGLDSGATAAYELLRTNCALPGPAERTAEDDSAILDAVNANMDAWRKLPGVVSLDVLETAFYEEETARIVNRYTASLLANANGWTDDYTAKMTAVRVVWNAEINTDSVDARLASMDWDSGVNACWFYLLPDPLSGAWEIWTSVGCKVPARYSADTASLPFAKNAQPTVSFTQYSSYEEAYNSLSWENRSFELFQELSGDGFTVVSWAYAGTPHGTTASLDVLYEDGTLAKLPLPPKSEWGVTDPAENLTLSEDGSTLTYTASFDNDLVSADGSALWHRAGTYRYAYDVAARTVSLTIDG